jgi:hypothetical protein
MAFDISLRAPSGFNILLNDASSSSPVTIRNALFFGTNA